MPGRTLDLDLVRACLATGLVCLQARSAWGNSAEPGGRLSLSADVAFATAAALHLAWLLSCVRPGLRWLTRSACCASRLAPKLVVAVQLLATGVPPATASWFTTACWRRQRWVWRALAEGLVCTCGTFPNDCLLLAAILDCALTLAVWGSMYLVTGAAPPLPAAAAHIVLRLLLSLSLQHYHRRAQLGCPRWLRCAAEVVRWRPRLHAPPIKAATELDAAYNLLRNNTPVQSSLLCCNNPAMLSRIAAASAQDLVPVRLEPSNATDLGPAPPPPPYGFARPPAPPARTDGAGATEAYDLARRLVASTSSSQSYASASRVRVSVKIPGRDPEDLPEGWDEGLRAGGQREQEALVLFAYLRRGCVQLVLDLLLGPAAAAATAAADGGGEEAAVSAEGAQEEAVEGVGAERPEATAERLGAAPGAGVQEVLPEVDGEGGRRVGAAVLLLSPVRELLQTLGGKGLLAGRTITLQQGADVALLRVEATSGGAASAATAAGGDGLSAVQLGEGLRVTTLASAGGRGALQLPPQLRAWPPVLHTGGAWARGRPQQLAAQEVMLSCAHDHHDANAGGGAAAGDDGLLLTARQHGSFLPVALCAWPSAPSAQRALRTGLAAGAVAAAWELAAGSAGSDGSGAGGGGDGGKRARRRAAPVRRLGFVPSRAEGLVQLELSQGGVHGEPAAVLLVRSAAVAHELCQLYASGATAAHADDVLRDYGHFIGAAMEVADAAARLGREASDLLAASWTLPPTAGGPPTPTEHDPNADPELRRLHAVAALGSRLGFALLPYLLARGMACCAEHVLGVLSEQLGVPPPLVARHACPRGMTLLHQACARGGVRAAAQLAAWLEQRGAAAGWAACSPEGLTPLHLLAVAADVQRPGAAAASAASSAVTAAALLRGRWPLADLVWRRGGRLPRGCGVAPADFCDVATPSSGPLARWWQQSAAPALALAAGYAWRAAAPPARWLAPERVRRAVYEIVGPASAFTDAHMEAVYSAWLDTRTMILDTLLCLLVCAFYISQALRGGPSLAVAGSGSLLVALRIVLHALGASASIRRQRVLADADAAPSAAAPQQQQQHDQQQQQQQQGASAGSSAGHTVPGGPEGRRSGDSGTLWRVMAVREARMALQESARMAVFLAIVWGALPMPSSWKPVMQLWLDVFYAAVLRPMAQQVRLAPGALVALLAVPGETAFLARVMTAAGWYATPLALARSAGAHALGLGVTMVLQRSWRRRFLEAEQARLRAACK